MKRIHPKEYQWSYEPVYTGEGEYHGEQTDWNQTLIVIFNQIGVDEEINYDENTDVFVAHDKFRTLIEFYNDGFLKLSTGNFKIDFITNPSSQKGDYFVGNSDIMKDGIILAYPRQLQAKAVLKIDNYFE